MARCLASLHGVRSGDCSPASSVLPRHCDFLPPLPPHFVSFAWRYHGSAGLVSSLPPPPSAKRRAWGWSPGIPIRACFRGNDRISQVSGEPQFPSAHVLGPRSASTLQTITERLRGPPPPKREGADVQQNFEAGYSMAFGSPPTYHSIGHPPPARLASRCWSGSPARAFHPQGSYKRFPTHVMFVFPLFQAS
jgi:hypothetical protein